MMTTADANKELENALESILKMLFDIIKALFVGIYRGIRKMRTKGAWIGMGLSLLVTGVALSAKIWIFSLEAAPVYIRYLIYYILLFFPLIYLIILGNSQGKSKEGYDQIFKDIGFVGRDGKCPFYCGIEKEGKKQILIFKSTIPLQDWKADRERLETGLDCNILKIENGRNKQIVKLTTVPSEYAIPKRVDWSDNLCSEKDGMITVGQGALDPIRFDLNRTPHVLVAGETGSGKSVILRLILWQMILAGAKVFMIDFKGGVEFGLQYEKYGEVITERERALEVLDMLCKENERRLKLFREKEVKNLREYNKKAKRKLCRIGVFSDEVAQMLDKTGVSKENKPIYEAIEGKLSTLARLSRATGINLFLGVQRPDAKILTGQIKNNVPVRISGRFADKAASEIVLGNTDAVDLPDIKGRFLYKVGNETIEFQAYYFDDDTMLHDVDVTIGHMLIDGAGEDEQRAEKAGNTISPVSVKVADPYDGWEPPEIEAPDIADFYAEQQPRKPSGSAGFALNLNYEENDSGKEKR